MLQVQVEDESGGAPAQDADLRRLFTHVIEVDRSGEIVSVWPRDARGTVPDNVGQFCFPEATPRELSRPFAFMLSGASEAPCAPLTSPLGGAGFSCIDGATYGVCSALWRSEGRTRLCVLSRHPYFEALCAVLEFIGAAASAEAGERALDALQASLGAQDFGKVGPGSRVRVPGVVDWSWPAECRGRMDLLAAWGLRELCAALPVDQILFLVGCLALELKVILVSRDLRRLSACAFGLLPLLRPCGWVQPFIPVLPHGLSVVCDAPVPVLVGCPDAGGEAAALRRAADETGHEALVVMLDQGQLELSTALATSYHSLKLPGLGQLLQRLPRRVPGDEARFRLALCATARAHVADLLAACRFFGSHAALLATSPSLPSRVLAEAEVKLGELVSALEPSQTVSPPWHFLARMQGTQLFIQWAEGRAAAHTLFSAAQLSPGDCEL